MLYRNLSEYFRQKYGKRLKKICIDGGFTCPNRDGTVGLGGCIFCGERGAGEHINADVSIGSQVSRALSGATDEDKFVAYFQNFTNTYAPVEELRRRYDAALVDDRIVALAIGTRPDCIDEETVALIKHYKKKVDVWVELGLQTSSDLTAGIINRGYKTERFAEAMRLLYDADIPVCVHLMIGLPGEGDSEILETVRYLSDFPIWGVKIHSVYVMRGTELEKMMLDGKYLPQAKEDYIRRAALVITHLPPDTLVHRLTGDCPGGMLAAPEWGDDKFAVIGAIQDYLKSNGLCQGMYYKS